MTLRRRAARRLILALACVSAAALASARGRDNVVVSEYEVKAAYLFSFIRLIEWPSPERARTANLPLCVLGESPVVGALEAMTPTPVKGRRLAVRRVAAIADVRACEVLFISERATHDLDAVVRAVPAGVLTVSEIETDDRVSSVINFVVEDDRVAFDINAAAAVRAQLSVSPRLLGVARAVDGRKRRRA